MLWTIATAMQLAAQPLPAEISYQPIAGGDYYPLEWAELAVREAAATDGPRLRATSFAPGAGDACLDRSFVDDAQTCLRALVPHRPGTSLVLVYVEEDRRPNVTGAVVNKSLNLRCVGARAVGHADFDANDAAIGRARESIRRCLADAARTPERATIDPASGAASWEFALQPSGLTRSVTEARGNALERAIVEIEENLPSGAPYRDCTLSARVSRIVGGWWLRAGDTVALPVPCGTNGVSHGRPALLYLSFDRQLRYLEPL
jgi:hypothetical protein